MQHLPKCAGEAKIEPEAPLQILWLHCLQHLFTESGGF